jgi:hypothetical protein
MPNKAVKNYVQEVRDTPKARNAALKCGRQTLGTTAQICSIAIPSWAVGVRFYPNSTALTYAIDEDPVAITAVGYTASVTGDTAYGIGGQALPSLWYEVIFEDGSGGSIRPSTIRMRPATNSSTVDIVFI